MTLTRAQLLALLGGASILHACAAPSLRAIRVGSLSSDQNATFAQIYAAIAETFKIRVTRHVNMGNDSDAWNALLHDDIDIYPGYVMRSRGAPISLAQPADSISYAAVRSEYIRRYAVTWLDPSPATWSDCLVSSGTAIEKFWALDMSKCSRIAPQLRLATTARFLEPGGTLEKLQHFYGGFRFKKIITCDPGEQYFVLNRDDADVATANTEDANIWEEQLLVLGDDKSFWPKYSLAPVVRVATLQAHPQLKDALNGATTRLNQYVVQKMSMQLSDASLSPEDVAQEFMFSVRSDGVSRAPKPKRERRLTAEGERSRYLRQSKGIFAHSKTI